MGLRQRIVAAAAVVCALSGVLSARALASDTEQTSLMDDQELIYSTPTHVVQRLAQIKSLGVDAVKVSVVWLLIAPDPYSTRRPRFDATDPGAYPYGAWDRYDLIARVAGELGMSVYFQLDPPVPDWAIPARQSTHQGPVLGHAPDAHLFGQFAEAVARRYSGSFVATVPPTEPSLSALGLMPNGGVQTPSAGTAATLPRVSTWGIWNEPNERSWLNPWWRSLGHRRRELLQPMMYRNLVDAAWSGLIAAGHLGDTILIGETANKGIMKPVPFVRALYCLDARYQPLRGNAARAFGCPTSGARASFLAAHPGLFHAAGYAHHPYVFDSAPSTPNHDPDVIALSSLGLFERQIGRILGAYGVHPPGGVALYMTEWGYKTRPPNPYVRTSLAQQAAWLNQGEFMTFEDPHVHALNQFELVDSPPKPGARRGTPTYWSTFQTGLLYQNGSPKPSYDGFRIPIWIPNPRHGSRVTIWGQLRPAEHSALQYGLVEYQASGRGAWTDIREVQTANAEGFLIAHVAVPAAGNVRLAWLDPNGHVDYSRQVAIR